jgi:hypothetical protein
MLLLPSLLTGAPASSTPAPRFPAPPTRPNGRRQGPSPGAGPCRPEQGETAFQSGRRWAPILPRRLPYNLCSWCPSSASLLAWMHQPWATAQIAAAAAGAGGPPPRRPRSRSHRLLIVSSRSHLLCPCRPHIFVILITVLSVLAEND